MTVLTFLSLHVDPTQFTSFNFVFASSYPFTPYPPLPSLFIASPSLSVPYSLLPQPPAIFQNLLPLMMSWFVNRPLRIGFKISLKRVHINATLYFQWNKVQAWIAHKSWLNFIKCKIYFALVKPFVGIITAGLHHFQRTCEPTNVRIGAKIINDAWQI